MMRKFNYLMLAAVSLLLLFGCRTETLSEDNLNNSNASFSLTSKRISLNQSKHRDRLLPKIEKIEAEVKTNAFGKVISYGNGVSINTDDVIYIENGPDFYTYTFKIERENAPANAPVENLVLSPLSDGSWREMLITYHLTDQEKQIMNTGGTVDLTGKVEYTPLESGTYSSAMKQDLVCYYKTVSYYTSCSENAHHHGEASDEDGGPCEADVQSVLVITVTRVCTMVGGGGTETGTTPGVTYPETGGGNPTNPNNGTNPDNPCGGNGIITQPQNPNSTLGTQEGCNTGTPTLPNLGPLEVEDPKTDCERLKEKTDDAAFKHKMDSIKNRVTMPNPDMHETSVIVEKYKGKISYSITQSQANFQADGTKRVQNMQGNYDIAGMHNHCPGGIPIFSFVDMVTFYDHYKYLVPFRKNEFSMFLVNFNGTSYALRMQDITALDALFDGMDLNTKEGRALAEDRMKKIYEKDGEMNTKQDYTADMAEKMMMKVLNTKDFGNGNSVFLYQHESNQWKKLTLNPDGSIQKIPCPQP
ncbi:hypothetical protein HNP38_001226 [Chryseobacterium defluvii]|uniref:Lipoprotein n=1 Tax=Chryseobacterium defluvii TaxID=160396 RepID=A0A840KDW6_9FLAO|nr:hypothetical protein [Chryseobacterium defluvii]MBB4805954.1 hypothetical protein [Chryseobacterium defluvii]